MNITTILTYAGIALGVLIAVWIGLSYLWNRKLRPARIAKGIATPTFGTRMSQYFKVIFVDDRTLVYEKAPKFLTRRIMYLVLALIAIAVGVFGPVWWLTVIFVFIALAVPFGRAYQITAERDKIVTRMFEVAHSEFRYDKGAHLNPWAFIQVKAWDELYIPGNTDVVVPAAFRSDSPEKRNNFENHFDGTVSEDNSWSYKWETAKGLVACTPVSHLPDLAPYPGSDHSTWDKIPMGIGIDGEEVWDVASAPHILVCGSTGGGKSVIQRTIIFHCIQHSDRWRFLGIDLKRVELPRYKKYSDVVLGVASTDEDAVEVMRFGSDEMMRRYELMENTGADHFMKLEDPPFALMIMVDEAYMAMATTGVKSEEGKLKDELHGEITSLIGDIARLGRAAGVHLVVATQRPDAKVIYGEIKENLAARYAAGRLKSIASNMVLDSDAATRIPGDVKGRAIMSVHGNDRMLQGYFASDEWIDEWLASKGRAVPEKKALTPAQTAMPDFFEGDDYSEGDDPDQYGEPDERVALDRSEMDSYLERPPRESGTPALSLAKEDPDEDASFDPTGSDQDHDDMWSDDNFGSLPLPSRPATPPSRSLPAAPAGAALAAAPATKALPARPGATATLPPPASQTSAPSPAPKPRKSAPKPIADPGMARPTLGAAKADKPLNPVEMWDTDMNELFVDIPHGNKPGDEERL